MLRAVVRYKAEDMFVPDDFVSVFDDEDCTVSLVSYNHFLKICKDVENISGDKESGDLSACVIHFAFECNSDFCSYDGLVLEVGNTSIALTTDADGIHVNDHYIAVGRYTFVLSYPFLYRNYVVMRFSCLKFSDNSWFTVVCDRSGNLIAYWSPDYKICTDKVLALQIDMTMRV